jgi:hypothetical protein
LWLLQASSSSRLNSFPLLRGSLLNNRFEPVRHITECTRSRNDSIGGTQRSVHLTSNAAALDLK